MKKIILTLAVVMTAFAGINAEIVKVRLYIPGMECENCEDKVEKSLSFAKGVKDVDCDDDTRIATIEYDNAKTNVETLQKTLLKDTKFESQVVKAKHGNCSGCKDGKCTGACKSNGGQHKEGCNHNHNGEQHKEGCNHNHSGEQHKQQSSCQGHQHGTSCSQQKTTEQPKTSCCAGHGTTTVKK